MECTKTWLLWGRPDSQKRRTERSKRTAGISQEYYWQCRKFKLMVAASCKGVSIRLPGLSLSLIIALLLLFVVSSSSISVIMGVFHRCY
jgi:hypothetical protein